MFKKSIIVCVSAAAILAAGAAQAAIPVVFYSLGSGVDTPLNTDTLLNGATTTLNPALWSGTGGFIQTGSNSNGALPAGPSQYVGPDYLTVPGGSETLTLPSADAGDRYIQIYIGSLDTYNSISFVTTGGTYDYIGGNADAGGATALTDYTHGLANGSQPSALTNGYFTFLFPSAIKSVTFSSTQQAFEIADIRVAPVPEPAAWALMILGVGLTGAALRLSRRNTGPLLAAV